MNTNLVWEHHGTNWIGSTLEESLIKAVADYLEGLRSLRVPTPVLLMPSMLGVAGVGIHRGSDFIARLTLIDRDVVILPDVLIERYGVPAHSILRPAIDAIWNAAGYDRSPYFDSNGDWKCPS